MLKEDAWQRSESNTRADHLGRDSELVGAIKLPVDDTERDIRVDRIIRGSPNTLEFALPVVSSSGHFPDSRKKMATRLHMPAREYRADELRGG
jgi:hypothetical protein